MGCLLQGNRSSKSEEEEAPSVFRSRANNPQSFTSNLPLSKINHNFSVDTLRLKVYYECALRSTSVSSDLRRPSVHADAVTNQLMHDFQGSANARVAVGSSIAAGMTMFGHV